MLEELDGDELLLDELEDEFLLDDETLLEELDEELFVRLLSLLLVELLFVLLELSGFDTVDVFALLLLTRDGCCNPLTND